MINLTWINPQNGAVKILTEGSHASKSTLIKGEECSLQENFKDCVARLCHWNNDKTECTHPSNDHAIVTDEMTKQDAWNHGDQENKDYAATYKQRSNPNRGSQIGNTFGDHLRDHRYKELPEHLQGGLLSEQSVYHQFI